MIITRATLKIASFFRCTANERDKLVYQYILAYVQI